MGVEKSKISKLFWLKQLYPIEDNLFAFDISTSFILAFSKLEFPIVSIVEGNINLFIVTFLKTLFPTVFTPSWIVNISSVFCVSNVYNHILLLLSIFLSIWSSLYLYSSNLMIGNNKSCCVNFIGNPICGKFKLISFE